MTQWVLVTCSRGGGGGLRNSCNLNIRQDGVLFYFRHHLDATDDAVADEVAASSCSSARTTFSCAAVSSARGTPSGPSGTGDNVGAKEDDDEDDAAPDPPSASVPSCEALPRDCRKRPSAFAAAAAETGRTSDTDAICKQEKQKITR